MPLNYVLTGLRGLLQQPPTHARWLDIAALLDQLAPPDLTVALDYARPHLDAWPTALLTLPDAWSDELRARRHDPRLGLVRRIVLAGVAEVDRHLDDLARAPALNRVARLDLIRCELLEPTTLTEIQQAPGFSGLSAIHIHGIDLGMEDLAALLDPGLTTPLTLLDLDDCYLEDADLEGLNLGGPQRLAALQTLRLPNNNLTDRAATTLRALAAALPALKLLDLVGNPLSHAAEANLRVAFPYAQVVVHGMSPPPA